MSRRTAEASKAIRKAWENEQQLVAQGKGTRDWNEDQQRDILDENKGKAYDENGKAFEGHHMQSAEAHPEYQGEPENIQFLTRQEHKDAHGGDFRNPTNGYYDPITHQTTDFGNGEFVPCKQIELSSPIVKVDIASQTHTTGSQVSCKMRRKNLLMMKEHLSNLKQIMRLPVNLKMFSGKLRNLKCIRIMEG
jgi:hypothetical protein